MTDDAPQRNHALREVLNGLRRIVRASAGSAHRTGAPWRMMPNAPPPWYAVYQQTQRRLKAEVVATLVHDRRAPAMTGINVPPFPPPRMRGAARSTWLKRFIPVMLESTSQALDHRSITMSEFRDLKPEEFRIFFEPASKGDSGVLRIRDFLELPFADDVTLKSPFGNIDIPVPNGSIRQHLMRRLDEFGGMDAYVTLFAMCSSKPADIGRLDEFGGMDAYVTLNIASVSFHVDVPIEGNKPRTPEEMDAMMRRELETRGLRPIHVPISGSNLPTGRSSPDNL